MNATSWWARITSVSAPSSVVLIRLLVGLIFLSEGIQKFLFPDALGVGRFIKIGIPAPAMMAPFVGVIEIVGGLLLLAGLLSRLVAVPLLINMLVAIWTTKLSVLAKVGFWTTAHEARTDFAMILGLVFLILTGSGPLSLDALLAGRPRRDG